MANIAIFIINIYRKCLSLLKLQQTCRFHPTCSQYAADAIQKKGLLRGCGLAVARLLKCHPFCPGGYDPVN